MSGVAVGLAYQLIDAAQYAHLAADCPMFGDAVLAPKPPDADYPHPLKSLDHLHPRALCIPLNHHVGRISSMHPSPFDLRRQHFDEPSVSPPVFCTPNSFWEIVGYTSAFLLIAYLKSPAVFSHPRFWAEEGTVFYATFLHLPAIDCLLFIKSGALQLSTNLAVYISTKVPTPMAPAVTTYIAVIFQVILAIQIALFIRAYNLAKPVGLLLVACSTLLPQMLEVWLNTTNLQWVTGLSALLIFLMPTDWLERHRIGAALWCVVCGLSGVPATILAPVFLLRAFLERSKPIFIISLALVITAIIQLAILKSVGAEPRPYTINFNAFLVSLLLQSVLSPVLSADFADWIGGLILSPKPAVHLIWLIVTLAAGFALVFLAAIAAYDGLRRRLIWLVLFAWLFVTLVQYFGSISPGPEEFSGWVGGRYFLLGSLCLCILLAWGTKAQLGYFQFLCVGLLCAIVVAGTYNIAFSEWPGGMLHGPSWRKQIAACPNGQTCRIKLWPDTWSVKIHK